MAEQVTVDLGAPVLVPETSQDQGGNALAADENSTSPLIAAAGRFWWAWLLLAGLIGAALALHLRQRGGKRERVVPDEFVPALVPAGVPTPPAPSPAPTTPPPSSEPPLPSGLITTRLRPKTAPAPQPRHDVALAPVGGVVSTGLRPWIELDVAMSDILLTEAEALLRFRLSLLNSGTAEARDVVIEALALNAGETQAAELATFYARPAATEVGVPQLGRLAVVDIEHQVRMPRGAIREYGLGDRRLFVPLLAFNASYRWHSGSGRTSAAFLIGYEQAGAERLAPLGLDPAGGRLAGLGVRRLDEQLRR